MAARVQENGDVAQNGENQNNLFASLQSLDRMLQLPVVDATWQQTQNVYGRVKGKSH